MSESTVPCAVCGTLSALETPFPPPGLRLWARSPGGVPWAGSLWQCSGCGALYHIEFVGHDMRYEVIERLPDELRPLVSAGTAWQEAWALRDHASPRAHAYLRDYLEHARYPWSAAADGIVGDLLDEHAHGVAVAPRALHYLRGLFGNYHGLMSEAAPPECIERVWERCRALRPRGDDSDETHTAWEQLEAVARGNIEKSRRRVASQRAYAAERLAAQAEPVPARGYVLGEERIYGSAPQPATVVDRPGWTSVVRSAGGALRAGWTAYLLPVAVFAFVMEVLAPNIPGDLLVSRLAVGGLGLVLYAAVASVVAGRWPASPWALVRDRSGALFLVWGTLILIALAGVASFGVVELVAPELHAMRGVEWVTGYAGTLLVGARLWPALVVTFVYNGYLLRQLPSVGPHIAWIGPGLRIAWRISGQRGFTTKVSLPLLTAAALSLAFLDAAGWALWARLLAYVALLPFLMQYADEAVDRWRISTGNPRFDR